jgi:ketosteroid isomerase-like protein
MNAFATQWIADWNAHDLDAILAHYTPDVEFHSPKVARFTQGAQTHFSGREALRPYFARAFEMRPNLRFDMMHVVADANGLAIVYRNEEGATAVELMDLNAGDQVIKARVLYDQ